MTDTSSSRRRRRSSTSFAPASTSSGGGAGGAVEWRVWLALAGAPALLYGAHLVFGANQPLAALILSTLLAVSLCVALGFPAVRRGLHDISPLTPPAVLFGLTVAVALWSLTAFAPGGPHPIWAWAGAPGGSITVNRPATLIEIGKLLGLACIFMVGALQSARQSWARSTLRVVLVLGAIYGLISLAIFGSGSQMVAQHGRLSGGFLSANSAATVFGMLTVIGLASLLRDWRQTRGLDPASMLGRVAIPLACVLMSTTCLLLTASRMGVVATLTGAVVLMLWELLDGKTGRLPLLIGGGVLLVVAVVLGLGGNDLLWSRVGDIGVDKLTRADILSSHWQAFLDSPLFGYGLGSFSDVNSQIMTDQNFEVLWPVRAAHNVYLQWLEEAGIVGAAPMFLLIATVTGVAVWRTFTLRKGQTLLRGLIAASVVILVHGTVDFALQVPSIAAFWAFLLGCQFSFGRR
ncbi:O-antigen ligase family protein [Brevundimonas goettingensis]|uniref:O-antigen ligase family protein n=1 Tax=Brevundimonas goettingensis TaxID=2774190 RepID=A0A975C0G0_9CAUL|nr:O-antigen ligase family protein [Brevundimonas goettingensis]QTC91468.1 O-antigen ligase family protein [Brevundimonas goettingensis]